MDLGPIPSFKYAIFSQTALNVANNMTVMGDIYSATDITVGTNATVCGSVLSAGGGVTMQNGTSIVTTYSALGCSGKSEGTCGPEVRTASRVVREPCRAR